MPIDTAVPVDRPLVGLGDIRVGEPVRSARWDSLARLAQWVRAHGHCVVPHHCPMLTIAAAHTLRYRVPLSGRAIQRIWLVDITASSGTLTLQAGSAPTSGAYSRDSGGTLGLLTLPLIYREGEATPITRSSGVQDLTLTITPTTSMVVRSVACWELPRVALSHSDATDLGIHLDSFFPRRPVYQPTDGASSVYAVARAAQPLSAAVMGRTLAARWGEVVGVSSTSWTPVLTLPQRIVPQLDTRGATTQKVALDVYARVSSGATSGEWRLTLGSAGAGGAQAIALGSTSYSWRTATTALAECTDPGTASGLRGGAADTWQLEVRRTAGAGTVEVQGWSLYETA